MSSDEGTEEKKDPIKIHREGTALSDVGKHEEAMEKVLFKAAECNYLLKDYSTATERFLKAADLAFKVGYDRFGVSALEYVLDCYKATGEKEEKAEELKKKIKEVKEKLSAL
jgi:hypothetical protein